MIRDATPGDYESIAGLMRAFIAWHYERHSNDRRIIDDYFDPEAFEAELAALPGPFAPPAGALLVAEEDARVVGCVALRNFGEGNCEMKRMFVSPGMHGKGVGYALASAIVARATEVGYSRMLLDTGPRQREAQGLYRKLGFRDVEPYYDPGPELREWLVFMSLDLKS